MITERPFYYYFAFSINAVLYNSWVLYYYLLLRSEIRTTRFAHFSVLIRIWDFCVHKGQGVGVANAVRALVLVV